MTEPRRIICDAIAAEFTNDAALVLSDRIIRALGQAGWGFVSLGAGKPVILDHTAERGGIRFVDKHSPDSEQVRGVIRSKGHLRLYQGGER